MNPLGRVLFCCLKVSDSEFLDNPTFDVCDSLLGSFILPNTLPKLSYKLPGSFSFLERVEVVAAYLGVMVAPVCRLSAWMLVDKLLGV
jgi:hypothetical protein